jgi:aromatic ring-cleaving dioxygenase
MAQAVAACGERSRMIETTTQSVANLGYHHHIYYNPRTTRAVAERVCAEIGERFRVEIDGFPDTPSDRIRSLMFWSFSSPNSSSTSCLI